MENTYTEDTKLSKLSIKEYLAVVTVKYDLSFQEFKRLSEWLECYEYIAPAKRTLLISFIEYLLPRSKNSHDIFKLALLSDTLSTCYSLESQRRILSWMKESNF